MNARRDALVLTILIAAVMLLIWNGSAFFRHLSFIDGRFDADVRIASTTLTLNVALILFGWRRYVDLQHEAELRADGERRAAVLAMTDPHSGLLNRKGFADRAQSLAANIAARGGHLAIVSAQIHRFKAVSDRHGYDVGDRLLRLLAEEITANVAADAVIARLSGDEFAVAMPADPSNMTATELFAEAVLRAITRPFSIGDCTIQVGAYAGIAASPAIDLSVPDLLRRADIALDHAKSGRVARPVWFDAAMERALLVHSEIEQGIRFALDHDQFVPFFEPQVDLSTGEVVGFEVLARWIHPLRGVIGASTFIPVAEDIGLIGPLTEKVIGSALAAAVEWDPAIKISVNISPLQLADSWVSQRIVRLLTETGFPADRLVVEITESSLFTDIDLARSIVTSLKNQGISLALDDFGTGFSSLAHLRALPFDMIKVDRAFTANIRSNKDGVAIIRAVSALASAIGVPVCVEGIEDEEALSAVTRLGCQIGQGWYFGKPMTAEQAAELLAQRAQTPLADRSFG
jgi:diguanylate cyclase (GGDEF)-like protein